MDNSTINETNQPYENKKKLNVTSSQTKLRNLIGFWILGLCNNYGYVIMLSAAFDLLKSNANIQKTNITFTNTTSTNTTRCNSISTGAILLADILPSLLIKLIAPFIVAKTNVRVIFVIFLSCLSFIITSLSTAHWITFIGVICAALSSGLGEVTFLAYSSYFDKDVISTWASGTGGAGVIGALSYASLMHALSTSEALQIMLVIPLLMGITFWIIIDHPPAVKIHCDSSLCNSELEPMMQESYDISLDSHPNIKKRYTLQQKITLLKPLLKYMIPLGLVYFAEYFINQGLMELLYFPNAEKWLKHEEQYRWYQVDYQLGVLLSRSSVNLFQVKYLWILPIMQFANLFLLLFEAVYSFIPNIWIVLLLIFYEGLLGGCAYVNTFYKISIEIPEDEKEFSLGVASLGDSFGIALSGIVSLYIHDLLCKLPSYSF